VLFTTAGMQQFKPYYVGQADPIKDFGSQNTTSCQKCIRTSDIEEVGDERHLTFFEMLGNFSFGGYFKEKAIELAYKFVVNELKSEIDYVTVFKGNENVPEDQESFEIWKKLGVPESKIKKEGADNFWGPTGEEGPCGPTTEIYVNGIEIWNIVFNQYFCDKNKKLENLKTPGIDTGMGLERLLKVVNNSENVFHTDLFELPHKKLHEFLKIENPLNERIILDHLKSATFLVADGVEPSNKDQGYILRRLIRRAIVKAKQIGIENNLARPIIEEVVETYKNVYTELLEKKNNIIFVIRQEEEKFYKTLESGIREIERIPNLTGEKAFSIYETYGVPLEVAEELRSIENREDFFKKMREHQELSRTASAGMFKGGLADNSEQTTKLHTAAHLMLAGLRKVLGDDVYQKGSNITAERLRFDFSHKEKMTPGQIQETENFVNGIIKKDLPVWFEEMTIDEARKINAMGVFESKYGDLTAQAGKVKVYFVGKGDENVSKEICGGPHIERTGILGHFKIIKEESSSSGVRRIKAIFE
jgi:alanyl-tRNA synthetase